MMEWDPSRSFEIVFGILPILIISIQLYRNNIKSEYSQVPESTLEDVIHQVEKYKKRIQESLKARTILCGLSLFLSLIPMGTNIFIFIRTVERTGIV